MKEYTDPEILMSQTTVDDPYWQELVDVGEISFHPRDGRHTLYLHVHTSDERYSGEEERELGVRLSAGRGVRAYVHARPCIQLPRIMVTVALSDAADDLTSQLWGEAVGTVAGCKVDSIELRQLGTAQAWYYPTDCILVLWECNVHYPHRAACDDPTQDTLLTLTWQGFERLLLDKFPDTEKVVTPGWEPAYEREKFQAFLRELGYTPEASNQQAFVKRRHY